MVQFGINGDPGNPTELGKQRIADDKVTQGNTRGFVSFAKELGAKQPRRPRSSSTSQTIHG